jgi:hypothetical protein
MEIQNLQLGFDIATAISVVGAAYAYIKNINKENDVNREAMLLKLRIEQTVHVVKDLLKIHEQGQEIARLATKASKGLKVDKVPTNNDMIEFCMDFERYVRWHSNVLLAPVAREAEKKILKDIRDEAVAWGTKMKNVAEGTSKDAPQLFTLLDTIASKLTELMNSVKDAKI